MQKPIVGHGHSMSRGAIKTHVVVEHRSRRNNPEFDTPREPSLGVWVADWACGNMCFNASVTLCDVAKIPLDSITCDRCREALDRAWGPA